MIEKIALEAILCEFVTQYEIAHNAYRCNSVRDYTQWNEDNIGIVDGYLNTYIFDDYAIDCIWLTKNNEIVLDCYKLESSIDTPTNFYEVCENVLFLLPPLEWYMTGTSIGITDNSILSLIEKAIAHNKSVDDYINITLRNHFGSDRITPRQWFEAQQLISNQGFHEKAYSILNQIRAYGIDCKINAQSNKLHYPALGINDY